MAYPVLYYVQNFAYSVEKYSFLWERDINLNTGDGLGVDSFARSTKRSTYPLAYHHII